MIKYSKKDRVEVTSSIALLLLLFYLFKDDKQSGTVVFTAVSFLVVGLFIPFVSNLICNLYFSIIKGLNWFSTRVILITVFYLFLTPISMLYRVFSKDPLSLKRKEGSYFTDRNHQYKRKDLENIW